MRPKVAVAAAVGITTIAAMVLFAHTASAKPIADDRNIARQDPVALAVAAADRAAENGLDALQRGVEERYERRNITAGPGGSFYVAYERTYRGLPVIGGDAVVVTDSAGRVKGTNAASGATRGVSTRPRVSADTAAAIAKTRLSRVDEVGSTRLVVLAWGGTARLAWEVVVAGISSGKPSIQHVFVDAHTGLYADSYDLVRAGSGNGYYNGQVTINTSGSGTSWSMTDPTRSGIRCGGQGGTAYTGTDDAWGNGSGTNLETACVDALYGVQREWDMLSQWLGRNGINGSGGGFPARVGLNDVNAFWNGSYTNFGHNQANTGQATPIDVVAHEYGHAIFQTTPGGAGSGNENGGLNEGTGDIFGALTEYFTNNANDPPDYLVGEEVNLVGNGPIRNMYNPSLVGGDPNCYSSSIPNTEVHAAAGPLNHWFYLLAEGSSPGGGKPNSPICTGGPASVTGISIQKAGKIFMGALNRKTSTWRYINVRTASLAEAVALYGAASAECAATKAAWNAVAVPAQSGEAQCQTPGNDFSMSLTPASGSVQAGQSASTTVGTQTTTGSAQTVNLSASGLPSGATASFNPISVTSGNSSTLTIATAASTPSGSYQVTVTGTGAVSHSVTFNLTVTGGTPGGNAPDISVDNVKAHLQQLQTFATNNGGNRRSTGAGYTASLSYIEQKLQAAGFTVVRQNCTSGCTAGSGPNLIADWPGGDANNVYMFGAHLDGVSSGPGINDNGTGSAALLEVALKLSSLSPTMLNHVRFGWWTDEEQGLNGSEFYVNNLSATDRSRLKGYFNFDMVGSPNPGYFIDAITSTLALNLKGYFDSISVQTEEMNECCSDDGPFRAAGIPATFLSTGASAVKSSAQATKWGGTAGQAFDPCYHSACDSYPSNVSTTALDRSADATAWALWKVAVSSNPPPTRDFSVSLSPASATVQAGQSATSTVSTQTTTGTAQTVNLSASGLPSGATASFNPNSVTSGASSTLTISTSATTPAGAYSVTVTGTGETATRTATFTLTVQGTGGGRTFTNGTNYNIFDNTYIQSTISSTASGSAVSPVKVTFTIVHSCAEDLDIWLRGPNGTWYQLKAESYGTCTAWSGARTYNVPVTQPAAGTWVLFVRDNFVNDSGYLDTWSITV